MSAIDVSTTVNAWTPSVAAGGRLLCAATASVAAAIRNTRSGGCGIRLSIRRIVDGSEAQQVTDLCKNLATGRDGGQADTVLRLRIHVLVVVVHPDIQRGAGMQEVCQEHITSEPSRRWIGKP